MPDPFTGGEAEVWDAIERNDVPDPVVEITDVLSRVHTLVESAMQECPRCIELELLCAELMGEVKELERQLDEIAELD